MALSHDDYMAARLRRIQSNALIARGDPGRFSSFERNALLGMQHTKGGDIAYVDRGERSGLQQHEMDMLKQRGENEFRVAEQKRFGMQEQGSDAAKFGADAAVKNAETEWAARKDIATADAEAKKYGFDKDLEARKYGADATVDAEQERGKSALEVERERGKAARDVAGIQQRGAEAVATQQARIAAAQQAHKEARQDNQQREALIQKHITAMRKQPRYASFTPEQLRAEAEKMVTVGGLEQFRK